MFFLCLRHGVTARYMEVAKASAAAKPLFSSQSNTQRDRFGGEEMPLGIHGPILKNVFFFFKTVVGCDCCGLEAFGSDGLSLQVLCREVNGTNTKLREILDVSF